MKNISVLVAILFSPFIIAAENGAMEHSADAIIMEFKGNPLRAGELFKNRRLTVRGMVHEVGSDPYAKRLHVTLRSMNTDTPMLRFVFSENDKNAIMTLSSGKETCLEGVCAGMTRSRSMVEFNQSTVVAPGNAAVSAVNNDHMRSLITIEGKNGSGTGFIAELDGRKVLVTNTHIIFENRGVKFTDFNNNRLKVSSMSFANDRDIAIGELIDCDIPALKIMENVGQQLMNKPLIVHGNSMGAGVNTSMSGSFIGVGPKTIEVSSAFVPGNSGSPIIIDNQVVGVATYALLPSYSPANSDTRFEQIRRFGTRLDNLKPENMQKFSEEAYRKDVDEYHKLVNTSKMLFQFLRQQWQTDTKIRENSLADFPELQEISKEWNRAVARKTQYASKPQYKLYASNAPFQYLLTKKLKPQLERRLKDARNYKYSYSYIAEQAAPYITIFEKMLDAYQRVEEQLADNTDTSKNQSRNLY